MKQLVFILVFCENILYVWTVLSKTILTYKELRKYNYWGQSAIFITFLLHNFMPVYMFAVINAFWNQVLFLNAEIIWLIHKTFYMITSCVMMKLASTYQCTFKKEKQLCVVGSFFELEAQFHKIYIIVSSVYIMVS